MNALVSAVRDPSVEEFDTRTLLKQARRQASKRHYEDFVIVDVDAHHYETESLSEIINYIEDPVLRETAKAKGSVYAGAPTLMNNQPGFQDMGGRIGRYSKRKLERTPSSPPHRDVHLTTRWMDALGVDIVCLFPTPMLLLGLHPNIEIEVALAQAYNLWLTENVLANEPRIKSMLYLPFNEPAAAYKTVKQFGDKAGVIGFMVTAARYKPVYHNDYMKIYSLLEEMGKPISFHAGYNWNDSLFYQITNRFITVHALGFTFHNMIHLTNWIVNGLPERFPKLKTIWIESGLAWVPFLMQRLDNEYMMRTSECPSLKRKPSDYIREMYFTTQPMETVDNVKALELTFEMLNAQTQLLYSSDYPHWDMDLPSVIYDLPFLTETAKRNILGGNACRLFNLAPTVSKTKLALKGRDRANTGAP